MTTSRLGRFYLGKDLVPIVREAGWAPGPVWMGAENLAHTEIRSPDLPARSESLYRLCYPGPPLVGKGKGLPQQAEVTLGVPGRLRPRIFSTFGTTRVVARQPNAPATFTPGEIPGTHFQRLSRPQHTWFFRKEPRKKSLVTPPGSIPGPFE